VLLTTLARSWAVGGRTEGLAYAWVWHIATIWPKT